MRKPQLTEHAQKRMQQRGISELMVQLIENFGRYENLTGGCEHCYIPKQTVQGLRKAIDQLDKQSLVIAPSGVVVTAQHRYQKIRSN
jgi:hypothetical protein